MFVGRRGRGGRRFVAYAALVLAALVASACSEVDETTQLSADEFPDNTAVPTTAMQTAQLPTTTTVASTPTTVQAVDPAATLAQLVARFASDPTLLTQISGLDLGGLAALLGVDLSGIEQLGLAASEIEAVAASVATLPDAVLAQLAAGQADAATLVAVLAGSIDVDALAADATGQLVQSLLGSIATLSPSVSPELAEELAALLQTLDPEGLGSFVATPANAALLALFTSVIIDANPAVAQQLIDTPLLNPALRTLLVELQQLGVSLSDTATIALLRALDQLIPGGIPNLPDGLITPSPDRG